MKHSILLYSSFIVAFLMALNFAITLFVGNPIESKPKTTDIKTIERNVLFVKETNRGVCEFGYYTYKSNKNEFKTIDYCHCDNNESDCSITH